MKQKKQINWPVVFVCIAIMLFWAMVGTCCLILQAKKVNTVLIKK